MLRDSTPQGKHSNATSDTLIHQGDRSIHHYKQAHCIDQTSDLSNLDVNKIEVRICLYLQNAKACPTL